MGGSTRRPEVRTPPGRSGNRLRSESAQCRRIPARSRSGSRSVARWKSGRAHGTGHQEYPPALPIHCDRAPRVNLPENISSRCGCRPSRTRVRADGVVRKERSRSGWAARRSRVRGRRLCFVRLHRRAIRRPTHRTRGRAAASRAPAAQGQDTQPGDAYGNQGILLRNSRCFGNRTLFHSPHDTPS